MVQGHKFILALVTTVFLIIYIKFFDLKFLFYNLVKIKNLIYFQKYFSILDFARAFTELYFNKIDCTYLR